MTGAPRTMARLAIAAGTVFAMGAVSPVQAVPAPEPDTECVELAHADHARERGGPREPGGMQVNASDQARIERGIDRRLDRRDQRGVAAEVEVPVYIHVMLDKQGNGDVTRRQIDDQIRVLNTTFGGGESSEAADAGFTFTLAGVDRYYNNQWHRDRASTTYRSQTRQGGAGALNMWLVEFDYLGVATFPWEYDRRPGVDGVRVHYDSLPGGGIENFNRGKTATHEVGHWLGLYHTFQGGCAEPGDEVDDTPAQESPTSGCPAGRDSCAAPGLDPIHNYMDYSYDSCYDQFTPGQAQRMHEAWTAFRA